MAVPKAESPTTVLFAPVVIASAAALPTAVLELPVVTANKALLPTATLFAAPFIAPFIVFHPTAVFPSLAPVAQVPPPLSAPINTFSEPPTSFDEPPLPQAL